MKKNNRTDLVPDDEICAKCCLLAAAEKEEKQKWVWDLDFQILVFPGFKPDLASLEYWEA